MNILLFGSKGQVGTEIILLAKKENITVFDYDIDTVDITKSAAVMKTFNRVFDVVINAAAYTAVDKAEDEPDVAYAANAAAVKILAEHCRIHDIPLIHISTDYVFDGTANVPYLETDQTNPLSIYGKSKLEGERLLVATWGKHVIVRTSWVFSAHGNNFVKMMIRLGREREEIRVVDDQHGCPTAAADLARVLIAIAKRITSGKGHFGIYHYCSAPATTWYQFAKVILDLAAKRYRLKLKVLVPIRTSEYPTRAKRPMYSELSVEKILQDYEIERNKWLPYLQLIIY